MTATDSATNGSVQAVLAVLGQGLVDPSTPVARADDAGLTRGDGCFEGCRLRVSADGSRAVDKVDAHFARMTRSAAALDLSFDEGAWRDLLDVAVQAWDGPPEAAMKLLLSRGAPGTGDVSGFVWITPVSEESLRQRRDGLRAVSLDRGMASDAFAAAPWLLGGVKTLSYGINMAAQREAARLGVDETIFVSSDGYVLEAPTGSVVWAQGRRLHTTPTGETGILAGTTQRLLFERAETAGWTTAEVLGTVDDLHAADVVWVISSVRGPVDVVELDGKSRTRDPLIDAEIRTLCGF